MSITGLVVGVAAVGVGFAVGVVTYRENTEQVEAVVGKHIDAGFDMYNKAKAKIDQVIVNAKTEYIAPNTNLHV